MSISGAYPSQVVRETAQKFIAHFSQSNPPAIVSTVSNVSSPLLTKEQKQHLRAEADQISSISQEYKKGAPIGDSNFYFVASGSHHHIIGHREYPGLVFKQDTVERAKHQKKIAKSAHEFAATQNRFWCKFPDATVIKLENGCALYAEERLLLGMDSSQHEEFWARVFQHLQSDNYNATLSENLLQLVRQIRLSIENLKIWDIGNKNFPEVSLDGTHVCGTDFENVDPEANNVHEGLERLTYLFPISPFIEELSERYQEVGVPSAHEQEIKAAEDYKKTSGRDFPYVKSQEQIIRGWKVGLILSQKELQTLEEALTTYDARGWVAGDKAISTQYNTDGLTETEINAIERILQECQKHLGDNPGKTLSSRKIFLQPEIIPLYHFTSHESYRKILDHLKAEGVIVAWMDDQEKHTEERKNNTGYRIYF